MSSSSLLRQGLFELWQCGRAFQRPDMKGKHAMEKNTSIVMSSWIDYTRLEDLGSVRGCSAHLCLDHVAVWLDCALVEPPTVTCQSVDGESRATLKTNLKVQSHIRMLIH